MTKEYFVEEVFVPGGMPKLTYISRAKLTLEKDLQKVSRNLCKLVTLTGSTKSGKTVLTNKIFPRSNPKNIWIDGGSIGEENDFWSFILEALHEYTSHEESTTSESSSSISGDATGEIGVPLLVKGKGKIGATNGKKSSDGEKSSRTLSPRAAAILAIRKHTPTIIIDDFHYLSRKFQGDIVRALKPLIFDGLAVVAIAIPHRRYDAVKVEKEMTQRIHPIPVPAWSKDELRKV
ncbi:MAG: hypothetical protein ABIJ49_10440 [Pseudomonadota bacterium]|nr:hypothetical protein [Gammaproteobacteria bacterium]